MLGWSPVLPTGPEPEWKEVDSDWPLSVHGEKVDLLNGGVGHRQAPDARLASVNEDVPAGPFRIGADHVAGVRVVEAQAQEERRSGVEAVDDIEPLGNLSVTFAAFGAHTAGHRCHGVSLDQPHGAVVAAPKLQDSFVFECPHVEAPHRALEAGGLGERGHGAPFGFSSLGDAVSLLAVRREE